MSLDINLTEIMKREGIRSIRMEPKWMQRGFTVELTCGGHCGIGETVAEALEDALEKNADYLHLLVKEEV